MKLHVWTMTCYMSKKCNWHWTDGGFAGILPDSLTCSDHSFNWGPVSSWEIRQDPYPPLCFVSPRLSLSLIWAFKGQAIFNFTPVRNLARISDLQKPYRNILSCQRLCPKYQRERAACTCWPWGPFCVRRGLGHPHSNNEIYLPGHA